MKPWSKTNQSPIGYKSKSLLGKKFITFSFTHKMADFTQCLPIQDRGTLRLIFDPCPGGKKIGMDGRGRKFHASKTEGDRGRGRKQNEGALLPLTKQTGERVRLSFPHCEREKSSDNWWGQGVPKRCDRACRRRK